MDNSVWHERLLPLFTAIDEVLYENGHAALAIDGPCCSGKSALSVLLTERYGGAVVPMDAFFLPAKLRTRERLAEPGGNVHYERFLEEAVPGISRHTAFSYRPYDCAKMALGDAVEVPDRPLLVVEGSYSMHPQLTGLYDITVFLEISEQEQILRLLKREDAQKAKRFLKEWIPMENRYFDAYGIRARADFVLSNEGC